MATIPPEPAFDIDLARDIARIFDIAPQDVDLRAARAMTPVERGQYRGPARLALNAELQSGSNRTVHMNLLPPTRIPVPVIYLTPSGGRLCGWLAWCYSCEQVSFAQHDDRQIWVINPPERRVRSLTSGYEVEMVTHRTVATIRCDWCRHLGWKLLNPEFASLVRQTEWTRLPMLSREWDRNWFGWQGADQMTPRAPDYTTPISRFGRQLGASTRAGTDFTITDGGLLDLAMKCLYRLEACPKPLWETMLRERMFREREVNNRWTDWN